MGGPPPSRFEMFLGGNVFQSLMDDKTGNFGSNGNQGGGSLPLGGIQVELYDATDSDKLVGTTTTDEQGEYGFRMLDPTHDYKVKFTYDGMRFEAIQYTKNISHPGGYSTAQEDGGSRSSLISRFSHINPSPNNYDGGKKAFGMYTKLEGSDGGYVPYSGGSEAPENSGAFRFYDALKIFEKLAKNTTDFNQTNVSGMISTYVSIEGNSSSGGGWSDIQGKFIGGLTGAGVSSQEANSVWQYINDTIVTAMTDPQPELEEFVLKDIDNLGGGEVLGVEYLYTNEHDQSREMDFGVKLRDAIDVSLLKGLEKVTILQGGQEPRDYRYDEVEEAEDGSWVVDVDNPGYFKPTRTKCKRA